MNRKLLTLLIVQIVCSFTPILADDKNSEADAHGTITGCVLLSKAIPKLPPLIEATRPVKDRQIFDFGEVPDETLIVDPESQGVRNAVVWLDKFDPNKAHPKLKQIPPEPKQLAFKNCRLVPHVICVRAGQSLQVINKDPIPQSPHDHPLKNSSGCTTLSAALPKKFSINEQTYLKAELLPFPMRSDYHTWINGYIFVQDHPYMTLTKADGTFELPLVPHGKHRIRVWHELRGWLYRGDIDVDEDSVRLDDITLELQPEERTKLGLPDVGIDE